VTTAHAPVQTVPSPVRPADPTIPIEAGITARRRRATAVIGTHFVIDAFSFMIIAMIPSLVVMLEIPAHQKALLLGLGSISSGLIQPIVAWFSDKLDTRLLGSLGFIVAVLAISNVGMVDSFWALAAVFAIGAMGVGAFHPPAAAAVGQLAGAQRSRYLAIFFLFGMLGGMAGNVLTPRYVDFFATGADGAVDTRSGLLALRWMILPGLASAAILTFAIRKVGHRSLAAGDAHRAWDAAERRARWRAVWLLYISNVLRFSVNMALVYLFTEWAVAHTLRAENAPILTEALGAKASSLNGILQASMQLGMGGGGMLLGFVLAARFEKLVFWAIPALGAIAIAALTRADAAPVEIAAALAIAGSVLSGFGFGACIPISMGVAQRMLPHRTSLASGLMLGGAWAFAFVGPVAAELVQNGLRSKPDAPAWSIRAAESLPASLGGPLLDGMGLDAAFYFTAGVLLIAGLISLGLPRDLMRRTHRD